MFNEQYLKIREKNEDQLIKSKCRICYSTSSSEINPLINPCNCSGSISYIHYFCLKKYLNMKIEKIINQETTYFNWKTDCCELCLSKYPKSIRLKNKYSDKEYNLIDLSIQSENYIQFKLFIYNDEKKRFFSKSSIVVDLDYLITKTKYNEQNNNTSNYVDSNDSNNLNLDENFRSHLESIKIDDNKNTVEEVKISIGRNYTNTVYLKEATVSRTHCYLFINLKTNTLSVENLNSKFGTLKLLKNKSFIIDNHLSCSEYNSHKKYENLDFSNSKSNIYNYPILVNSVLKFNIGKHLVSFSVVEGGLKSFKNYFSNKFSCCMLVERNRNNNNSISSNLNNKNIIENNYSATEGTFVNEQLDNKKVQIVDIKNEINKEKSKENENDNEIHINFDDILLKEDKFSEYDSIDDCELNIQTVIKNDESSIMG